MPKEHIPLVVYSPILNARLTSILLTTHNSGAVYPEMRP